jgi:hypothetical protein
LRQDFKEKKERTTQKNLDRINKSGIGKTRWEEVKQKTQDRKEWKKMWRRKTHILYT